MGMSDLPDTPEGAQCQMAVQTYQEYHEGTCYN